MSDEMNKNQSIVEGEATDGIQDAENFDGEACKAPSDESGKTAKKSKNKKSIIITSIVAAVVLIAICVATWLVLYNISSKSEGEEYYLFSEGLVPVSSNGKCGYVDKNGDVVIELLYDYAESFSDNGLALVKQDGEYFFINTNGETVGKKYFYAYGFREGFEVTTVMSDLDTYGVINSKGEEIVPIEFDNIILCSDDVIVAEKVTDSSSYLNIYNREGNAVFTNADYNYISYSDESSTIVIESNTQKYGLINTKGEIILPFEYEDLTTPNSGGYAMFKKDGKWGVINEKGKVILKPKYDFTGYGVYEDFPVGVDGLQIKYCEMGFNELNVAIVGYKKENGDDVYGLINQKGEEVLEVKYDYIGNFSIEDKIVSISVKDENGEILVGYAISTGRIIVEPQFSSVYRFENGYATAIGLNGESYIINKYGKVQALDDKEYIIQGSFSGSPLPVYKTVDGEILCGYVNANGETVIEFMYERAHSFYDTDYATVKKNDFWYIINKDGDIVSEKYKSVSRVYSDGYAVVSTDGEKYGIIKVEGDAVTGEIYDHILNLPHTTPFPPLILE